MKSSSARICLCLLSVMIAASVATGVMAAPNSHAETLEKQLQDLKREVRELQTRVLQNQERDPTGTGYVGRCETGTVHTTPMYGSGVRTQDLTALFSRSFFTTPVVTVGLGNVDQGHTGTRVTMHVRSVSTTGVVIRIGTYADTVLYGASVHWMACA
ncbi:hypothetical protein Bbelb_088330 [Branchiostoma belcheri]|nr:hypothetical protein Bbelb_088330 [Branchiostoma belcheri]